MRTEQRYEAQGCTSDMVRKWLLRTIHLYNRGMLSDTQVQEMYERFAGQEPKQRRHINRHLKLLMIEAVHCMKVIQARAEGTKP